MNYLKETIINVDETVKIIGRNVPFVCNICKKNFKCSHFRVKIIFLKLQNIVIDYSKYSLHGKGYRNPINPNNGLT